MTVRLAVTAGPHAGKEFVFDQHDTLLVGRAKDAHLQLPAGDPYFSRRHFLLEVHPPRCRAIDLNSRNGIYVNGERVQAMELRDGDVLKAGHTEFRVSVPVADADLPTIDQPPDGSPPPTGTVDRTVGRDADLIPGYQLRREIGRGGMGCVYKAIRQADGAAVAVKVIVPSDSASPRQIDRFLREARLLGGLTHPHVTTFLHSGVAGDLIYLVMELVDGPDAGRLLRANGPLAVPTAVRITCQVLAGLAHAHSRGIVHRDVKPSNVLIGRAGAKRVAKVADFGLARVYDECKLSGVTFQGEVGGTPAFMAPEQVTHFRDVRPAADQYSAAATLYNLLTAAYPHDLPKRTSEQLAHIISADAVPVRDRRPGVPPGLAAVLHRGLARDPAARYPNCLAFRTALARQLG
jgi:serine/threonine-protein kinase